LSNVLWKHLRDADHSKRNIPVTASMSAFLPGPIAGTVLDPANTYKENKMVRVDGTTRI